MQQNAEPMHRFFGTPLAEWLASVPNELPDDAVGLWQVILPLAQDFGLTGPTLDQAVRVAIRGLLSAGALPVHGATEPNRWIIWTDLIAPGEAGVDLVMEYWHNSGHEADLWNLWFALPQEIA